MKAESFSGTEKFPEETVKKNELQPLFERMERAVVEDCILMKDIVL